MTNYLKSIAIAGNVLFIFWMLYNGIHERFTGAALPEIVSYIVLACLLLLNIFLLRRRQ